MVAGGKKNKNEELGKKSKKGKKKGGKLHEKRGKGLKNVSFWVKTPKIFAGGLPNPRPARRKLIRREKNFLSQKRGGG